MTAVVAPRLMTADELAKLSDDGWLYELSQGRLIRLCPASPQSSGISGEVHLAIGNFAKRRKLGRSGVSEGGFRLASNPDTVRAPDIWFVRKERIPPEGLPKQFWALAPDLAVEILSPSDRFVEVMRKVSDYLRAGVRLVWVIDPDSRSAGVFAPGRSEMFVDEDGALDGEDVLPGFRMRLTDVLD